MYICHIVLIISFLTKVNSSNILFFIGALSSYSHRSSIQPLANKLAYHGHNVTILSPLATPPGQNDKIRDYCPPELQEFHKKFLIEAGVKAFKSRIQTENLNELIDEIADYYGKSEKMCSKLLKSRSFENWIKSSQDFDLIIIDAALNTCAFGIGHYFKAKIIIYSPFSMAMLWDYIIFGLTPEFSWLPGVTTNSMGGHLTLVDRLVYSFTLMTMSIAYRLYHLPKIENLLRDSCLSNRLGNFQLEQVIRNTSLMFVNQHYSDQYPKSYPPFVIPVGGIHLESNSTNETLPIEMEKFIQEKEFIFISFGSLIKVSTMPRNVVDIFFQVIEKSKINFLFKWDGPVPENHPKNIYFRHWFPQQDILKHPKIRGFITQGGQVSLQQGIFNQVPLIILPVLGDQDFNAVRATLMGHGIVLELGGLTASILEDALNRIINDKSFKVKAQVLGEASQKRQMSALDEAFWWVHEVLINDDLSYLKPLSMGQSIWRLWCLDLWSLLFLISGGLLLVFVFIITFIFRLLFK